MPMRDFFWAFPKLAASELRTLTVAGGSASPLPADRYAFVEHYCDERGCDCRRVTLSVFAERQGTPVASINFGFDSAHPMAGPFLDPLHAQAPYAPNC